MEQATISFERLLDAPPETVWQALTDPARMKQWYFDIPGFRAEKNFEFEFVAGEEPHRLYRHCCRITEVIPGRKIAYTWRYDGYEGDSLVSFELTGENGKTRLKLTHSGLDTFPSSNPDLAPKNFVAGWTHIIDTSLKNFVE